jgi:transcriptional regulator with XRE-family HTH domain
MSQPTTCLLPSAAQLGHAIHRLRLKQGLSIETLAFAADLDPTHVGRIERGHGNPRLEILSSLARALGISLGALMLAVEAEPGEQ